MFYNFASPIWSINWFNVYRRICCPVVIHFKIQLFTNLDLVRALASAILIRFNCQTLNSINVEQTLFTKRNGKPERNPPCLIALFGVHIFKCSPSPKSRAKSRTESVDFIPLKIFAHGWIKRRLLEPKIKTATTTWKMNSCHATCSEIVL